MITHAAYARTQSPVVALDGRAFAPTGKARPFSGPAPLASPPLNSDGVQPLIALHTELRLRRQRALLNGQSKLASSICEELRALTHAILSHGGCQE